MEMPLRRVPADTRADVQSEPWTFEAFYGSVHRPVFGALRVITGNRTDAEDISEEAFLRVWERWERVALMDNPEAFLFRTAMNVFRNRSRRARLAFRRPIGGPDPRDELAEVEERDLLSARSGHSRL
jgi:DNA-directed RNA polymerase specialized sigma24 family protein